MLKHTTTFRTARPGRPGGALRPQRIRFICNQCDAPATADLLVSDASQIADDGWRRPESCVHVERAETDCSVLNSVALDRDAARGGPLEGAA